MTMMATSDLFGATRSAKPARWRCLPCPGSYPAARVPLPAIPPARRGGRRVRVVDSFAGGGGASNGIRLALLQLFGMALLPVGHPLDVDFAVNHDDAALCMHAANHPDTIHLPANVWQVAEFLRRHGCWDGGEIVTLSIRGVVYVIVDIGMRMLTPRELARAQGFPDSYKLDPIFRGKPLSETEQRHKIGNSVCEKPAAAVIVANYRPPLEWGEMTAPFLEAAE